MSYLSSLNPKLRAKLLTHSSLIVLFASIYLFSQLDIAIHVKLPFILLALWVLHITINRKIVFSFISGKIRGAKILLKMLFSVLLLLSIVSTILLGITINSGVVLSFITEDFAYDNHKNFALITATLLFIHLWQNRQNIKLIWGNLFAKK